MPIDPSSLGLASHVSSHVVIPGQIIAISSSSFASDFDGGVAPRDGDHTAASKSSSNTTSWLRGHGTYTTPGRHPGETYLIASVMGYVRRVNQLISVEPASSAVYTGHVGDLVVGRIVAVTQTRWKVQLSPNWSAASLPLTGVHLPGGAQRIRTVQDQRDMRQYLAEGDLISAEVQKIHPADGSLVLHTRSARYGKLEQGSMVLVPPGLIPRRKHHVTPLINQQFLVLWGCNGMIWMQRNYPSSSSSSATTTTNKVVTLDPSGPADEEATLPDAVTGSTSSGPELVEWMEERQRQHAALPYTIQERQGLARLRQAILCARYALLLMTPETVEQIYRNSLQVKLSPPEMIFPEHVLTLTAFARS